MERASFWVSLPVIFAVANLAEADSKRKEKPTPPSCVVAALEKRGNNAKEIAEGLNGVTEGITARAVGTDRVVICGDNTRGAVTDLAATASALGKENTPSGSARESHVVKLFHNRDSAAMIQVLQKAFPKLAVSSVGSDTLVLGAADGSDAATARSAKRLVAALDVPRPEVTLNVWSVQVSSKRENKVDDLATEVRRVVTAHNRALQEALGRAHGYLVRTVSADPDFYAPVFKKYVGQRYVVQGDSDVRIDRTALGACPERQYCLGYGEIFDDIEPNLSSMLVNILASQKRQYSSGLVDELENRVTGSYVVETKSYAARSSFCRKPLPEIYDSSLKNVSCEELAEGFYDKNRSAQDHETAPVFPCLREALSDATEPIALARLRMAMANFLFVQKFRQQYPDDFDPENLSARWIDSMAGPLLGSFNRDMASFLRHVRGEVEKGDSGRRKEFVSNGIVTLSTVSSIASSVSTTTQNEFKLPPTFSLKDFLGASVPPTPGSSQTPAQAVAAKLPAFLAANLAPGVSLPLNAFLGLESAPAVASLGRNLNLIVTSNSLPGASGAELNLNLISQEEAPPTVQRGSTSKPDTKSRVAKHNVQSVVRVDSMRLFELSSFSAELRRGGESIPLIPPYVELPIIGSLVRLPTAAARVYHRSFAIVSAVVLPTSADLASSVTPLQDVVITNTVPTLTAKAAKGSAWKARYTLVADRQDGILTSHADLEANTPDADHPVSLTWPRVGGDAHYSVYRERAGRVELLEKDLVKLHFEDAGTPGVVARIPDGGSASAYTGITPAAFLSGGVRGFHAARLDCIRREASGDPLNACEVKTLRDFPAEN